MLDVLPKILNELRDADAVDAIVAGRVRGYEPAPGDSQGGTREHPYKAFVVVVRLASPRHPRLPIQFPQIFVRCYGRDRKEAFDLYAACSDVIHDIGPRVHPNGLGIYISKDSSGASQDRDPDTQQPLETFVVSAIATTVPVGAGS